MATYVFISYGHDNDGQRSAELLFDYLSRDKDNIVVWWDQKIGPREEWLRVIDNHLNELIRRKPDSCLIYVATPYSANTERDNFCINEIIKAVCGKVRVIPLKVVETPMPLLLCNKQWMDLSDISIDKNNQELQRRMDELLHIINDGIELPRDGKQLTLMSELEPCNFSLDLDNHLKEYEPRTWLLDIVRKWITQSDEKLLLLLGGPGTGKTAFSIWMSYCELSEYVGAWHLCQYNDKRTCSLKNAVKSIAYYLATRIPDYYNMLDLIELDKILSDSSIDAGTLFKILILEKLKAITHDAPVVILIDALDEASHDNYNELAVVIARYADSLPSWLKIIITGRNDPSITTHLLDLAKVIDLDDADSYVNVSDDINRYVGHMLADDTEHARSVMTESGNNFLFAKLLCNYIRENHGALPTKLPRGINSYYNDYMRRYFVGSDFNFADHARPLLNLILTAYEPLATDDILRRLKQTCPSWCRRHADFDKLVSAFGPLLKKTDGALMPFHKSFSDWLFDHSQNRDFPVYRDDGLDDIIDWGYDVIADQPVAPDNNIVRHFYTYLPQYLIEANDNNGFIKLYTDIDFWKQRSRTLGVNRTLALMIDELTLCKQNTRQSLFAKDAFFDILYYFDIDLFNTGRFANLHNLGYVMYPKKGMDDNHRLLTIRYLYISGLFKDIDDNLSVFEEPYDDHVVEAMLMNELGQTYRKLGQLSRSAFFYQKSLDGARKYHGTLDEIIYTLLNLSRIYTLQCRFDEAQQLLHEAREHFDSGQWHDSMQGTDFEFSAQQLARGVYYVALETENFALTPDDSVCSEALKWADDVYGDPKRRDRYYPNHLIGKLFYMIRAGVTDNIDELIAECERSISSEYDNFRLSLVKALLTLSRGQTATALDMACEKLTCLLPLDMHMIQRSEFAALVDHISSENHLSSLPAEFHPWYNHFRSIIHHIDKPD